MRRHRQHRIALIPLDDRPCNTSFPVSLGRMIDYEVILPPRSLLGHFTRPGKSDEIGQWLRSVAPTVDCAVVSADMLAYGGLVASRTLQTPLEVAAQRLETLERVRKACPNLAIFVFSVLMRHGITVTSEQTRKLHEKLRRYSTLAGPDSDGPSVRAKLRRLEAGIGAKPLARYIATRERNHNINRLCVEKVASGTINFLALCQEDAAVQGVHRQEQQELETRARELAVTDSVSISPGADEAAMVLLARFVHEHMEDAPSVYVRFSDRAGAQQVAPFEDRSIAETVSAKIAATGCRRARSLDAANLALFVHVPPHAAEGEDADTASRRRQLRLQRFVRGIRRHIERERLTAVADVAEPNLADPALTDLLFSRVPLHLLAGYAAWNTAANSIGTALVHACMRRIALMDKGAFELKVAVGDLSQFEYLTLFSSLVDSERAHLQFLFSRFVEDSLYQTVVRPKAIEQAEKAVGANVFELGEHYGEVESFIRSELTSLARELFIEHFLGRHSMSLRQGDEKMDLVISELDIASILLPWQRTFEVSADFAFSFQVASSRK